MSLENRSIADVLSDPALHAVDAGDRLPKALKAGIVAMVKVASVTAP